MKNVSDKTVDMKHTFHVVTFFYHSVYEIMWKIIVERGRLQMGDTAHVHCMLDN